MGVAHLPEESLWGFQWLNAVNQKANLLRWDVLCTDAMLARVGLGIGCKELLAVISLHSDVEESEC